MLPLRAGARPGTAEESEIMFALRMGGGGEGKPHGGAGTVAARSVG